MACAGLPVQPRHDLVLLVVGRVGQRVDVRGQAGRGRGVNAGDMVVYAELLRRRLDRLLDQMHEVWWAEFAQRLQRL